MKGFGWILFGVGCALVLVAGFWGSDAGRGLPRIANLPGVLAGIGLMISGSIFAAIGYQFEKQEAWFRYLSEKK